MTKKKSENTEEIKKPKAISPFDIIKMMFTDVESFNKLSNLILTKNFFMINRILSIMFPMQAQCFNNVEINQAEVIRTWQRFVTAKMGYGRVPGFVYTKGAKATQELNKLDDISKEDKESYCKHYQISLRDFDDMLYFTHDSVIEHFNNFVKINSQSEQNKTFTKSK
jgi:hypothetical protein